MKKLYSPAQIVWGTFFGGTLAALWFFSKNLKAMSKEEKVYPIAMTWLMITLINALVAPFLLGIIYSIIITPLIAFIAYLFVINNQLSKEQIKSSDEYCFHTNLNVFGVVLLWSIVSSFTTIIFQITGMQVLSIEIH